MAAPQQTSKLRVAGVFILVLGMVGAGVVFVLGQRAANFDDDPSMAGYDKRQNEQMEQLYGKSGQLMEDLANSLKKPNTQAGLILATSVITSLICFRLAEPLAEKEEQN